ncbi:MAG TPA: hypothetical protein VGS20_02215 [Candidatus Acidoferrales bacterium]|nr:hypothetical protein [Candidatus Acidoferrales bacterium]
MTLSEKKAIWVDANGYILLTDGGAKRKFRLSADAPSSDGLVQPWEIPALVDAISFEIRSLANKLILGATSPSPPALASNGTQMPIGWKGSGNDNLNVAQVALF